MLGFIQTHTFGILLIVVVSVCIYFGLTEDTERVDVFRGPIESPIDCRRASATSDCVKTGVVVKEVDGCNIKYSETFCSMMEAYGIKPDENENDNRTTSSVPKR